MLVITGLLLANLKRETKTETISLPILAAALMNCILNAISGTMDKILMENMEAGQLQFWFLLFMTIIYGCVLLAKREKVNVKNLKSNYWVILMSLSLMIGDKLLFVANANPLSEVTLMTLIKQSSVIVTVLTGWLVFKEKNILYKLLCAGIVVLGIIIPLI